MIRPGLYLAGLIVEGLAATTRYILIDLSDQSGYPHRESNGLRVYRLFGNAEKRGTTGTWLIRIGVVLENDTTDGTVQWFHTLRLKNNDEASAGHSARSFGLEFGPDEDGYLHVRVISGALQRIVSNSQSADVAWAASNAGNLADATGATNKSCGAGDIVVEALEVADGGTLDFTIQAYYGAE